MSTIHQIYCTHCTHGTSALERREGELAHRMLGYSARAGSLEARDLKRYYRQIERYVYYYLPRDTPSEEKLRLSAASAPRRLVYHPSTGGLQVVGQVCYRQTDTEGRPGSYFAHVLFREHEDGGLPWSQLDCLKLWGASGWVEEDSPYIPFLLQPLGSLDQMLGGCRPAVDDHVFLSFLSTPAGGSFDDPAGAIPERWRRMDAAQRARLFVEAFGGFLEISSTRRESLLLVIEPSAAVLLFYGIIRLLPAGELRDGVSFSTFEPNTDRVGTSLAATLFYDPQKTDLRGDAYRSRGFVINTFSKRRSETRRPEACYAPTMARRLIEQGWDAVDWSLASLASAGARRPEDLEALAAVDKLVPALLDPGATCPGDAWRRSPMASRYLRQALARELSARDNPYALLERIVGRPAHLTVLELIASEPEIPGTRSLAAFLLERLPGDKIADLLKLDDVSSEAKVDVLVRYVSAHTELPPGCDHLWTRAAGSRTRTADSLLPRVLARLDLNTLEAFYKQVAAQHSAAFLASLFSAYKTQQCSLSALTQIVQAMDDQAVLSLFRTQGAKFFGQYPDGEPALGARLHAMVGSLGEHARQFPERLDAILAGRHLLPDKDQDVVTAWANCRRVILEMGRLQEEKSGILRKTRVEELEAACCRMAQEARKAMPPDRLDDDRQGSRKQTCLRQIGQRLLEGRPLLPNGVWQHDALWQKVRWYFENRTWPSAPLRKMCPRSRSLKTTWIILGTILAVALVMIVIGALNFPGRSGSGGEGRAAEASKAHVRVKSDPSERAAPSDRKRAEAKGAAGGQEAAQRAAAKPERDAAGQTASHLQTTPEPEPLQATVDPAATQSAELPRPEPEQPTSPPAAEATQPAFPAETAPSVSDRQVGVSRPIDDAAVAGMLPAAETWKQEAEQFARQHAGMFFDEAPLVNGELEIPADALPAVTDAGGLFLGGGVLYFDTAMLPFGAGFNTRPPVSRHELPELADAFAFPSVYVELQARPSGAAVVLDLVPQSMPPDAEAKKEAIIDDMERSARMIVPQLRAYNSRTVTEQEKDEAFDKLVELTGIEIPSLPAKPDRRSPEYSEKPEAYEAALEQYNEAVAARSRAKSRVIPTAKLAVSSVDERTKFVEDQFRRYQQQLREHNEQGAAALNEQCRRISVIVYRAAQDGSPAGTPAGPPTAADQPGVEAAPAAGAVESIDGQFGVEEKLLPGLRPPAIAQIRPIVTGDGGRPLPPWYRDHLVAACRIVELGTDGFLMRTTRLRDISVEKTADVFQKTTTARVRFEFFPRSDKPPAQQPKAPIAAASHVIEPIEEGKQYTITLQLSRDALDWLRLLSADPDTSKP